MINVAAICRGAARRRAPSLFALSRGVAGGPTLDPDVTSASAPAVRPYEDIPGPVSLPLIGAMWTLFIGPTSGTDIREINFKMKKQYGSRVRLSKFIYGKDLLLLFDPVDVEKVFRNEGPSPRNFSFQSLDYYRRVLNKEKYEGAFGLLSTQDAEWQDFRRRVQPHMLQPRVVRKYAQPIDLVATDFIQRLREIRDSNGMLPEDAVNWFFRWALESIATIALDTRLGCLNPQMAVEPQQLIDAVQVLFEGLFRLDMRPSFWRYFSTPMWRRYVKALDVIQEVALRYIHQKMDEMKTTGAEQVQAAGDLSVLEKLLMNNDNPRVATTMATDMMIAGIDTTSYATATLLYLLSRNPDKQEELYQELRRVLPEKDTPVTAERLQEMKYLRAAIKESMRLLPVAGGQAREITADNLTVSNFAVPKGIFVMLGTGFSAVDPEHFPDPESFVPERWLRDHVQHRKSHPFATLPFGFGARMCIGMRFAELEVEVLSAKILRNFKVEYPREAKFESRVLYHMTSPLTFRLIDRP